MKIVTAIAVLAFFLFSSYRVSYRKARYDFVNKKKNQAIYAYTCNDKECHYRLWNKDSDEPYKFTVPAKHVKTFADSLKRNGWTTRVYYDVINKYKPSAELVSATAQYTRHGDTVYRFIYNLKLTYLKNNTTRVKRDTIWGTNKINTIEAFANHKHDFDPVFKIRGTTVLKTGLMSAAFRNCFEPDRSDSLETYYRSFYF